MAFEIEDHIRIRAYHLWEANGRPQGRDLEFWEQARQTVSLDGPVTTKRPGSRSMSADSGVAKTAKRSRRTARRRSD